jgi:ABC-type Zn uptake system ZnuABC Zn-binding protein ZnuA
MDALVLARRTVEGVANGDFMIMTHPHIVGYAEKRWREISAAIAAVPPFDDPEQYDVARVQKEVLGG